MSTEVPFREDISNVWKFQGVDRKPLLDNSIIEYEWDKYLPDNSSDINGQSIWYIRTKDTSNPLLMQDAFVLVECQIQQTDAATALVIDTDNALYHIPEDIALVNTGAPFNRVVYKMNERTLTDTQDWHHANLINRLTEQYKDFNTHGESEFWYPDKGAGGVVTHSHILALNEAAPNTVRSLVEDPDYNKGFYDRRSLSAQSVRMRFKIMVKDLCPIYKSYGKVVQGFTHTFELHKNSATSMVIADAGQTGEPFTVRFNSLQLWVPHIKANDKASVIYQDWFVKQEPYFHGFCDYRMYRSGTQASGDTSYSIPISSTSQRPSQVFVVLSNAVAESDQTVNSMLYLNNSLSKANIKVDGTPLMRQEYNPDFSDATTAVSSNYHRLYEEYVKYMNKKVIGGCQTTYKEFKDLYPVLRFDLSKLPADKFSQKRSVDLSIDLDFTGGADTNFRVLTMVCTDRILQLNPARKGEIVFSDSPMQV